MSNETVNTFIKMVIEENLVQAQATLKEYLNDKLTEVLQEKYEEYAPSIFEAKGAKPDFLDLDGDGNTKESMKQAAKQAEEGDDEDEMESDEEQSGEEEEEESDDEADEEDEDEE